MITFHEIRRIIQKMAVLSGHIVQLNQLLPQVIQLTEKIDSLNEDLTLERDRMTAKIRSVEVLGEILKTHVYQNAASNYDGQSQLDTSTISQVVEDDPSTRKTDTGHESAKEEHLKGTQSGFYQHLDGRTFIL